MLDCLVVGGGPAGLTAAIYLARFHLDVTVIDAGRSRAASIPRTHNHAGFPDGVAGIDLVNRMREQATRYGARIEQGEVTAVERSEGVFQSAVDGRRVLSRTVLLATGVHDQRPAMPRELHDEALARGLLRYCPICDGFEITDRRIGVLGAGEHGRAEALFLLSYTPDVTLITQAGNGWSARKISTDLSENGIRFLEGPAQDFRLLETGIEVRLPSGNHVFDSLYPALGCASRSDLAVLLGAEKADNGAVVTDRHQETAVPGLYAAGDVVEGINQISHAMGQAAVAATAIRNALNERTPLRRAALKVMAGTSSP